MSFQYNRFLALSSLIGICLLTACSGGGGSGSPPTNPPVPTPTSIPTTTPNPGPPITSTQTVTLTTGSSTTVAFPAISDGTFGTLTFPPAISGTTGNNSSNTTFTLSAQIPSGVPAPAQSLNDSVSPIAYITMQLDKGLVYGATPDVNFNFSNGTLGGYAYLAFYDPNNPSNGWTEISNQAQASGNNLHLLSRNYLNQVTFQPSVSYVYAIVENVNQPQLVSTPANLSFEGYETLNITLSENGYNGAITITNNNPLILTTPITATMVNGAVTIPLTARGVGHTNVLLTDVHNQQIILPIDITRTKGNVN